MRTTRNVLKWFCILAGAGFLLAGLASIIPFLMSTGLLWWGAYRFNPPEVQMFDGEPRRVEVIDV